MIIVIYNKLIRKLATRDIVIKLNGSFNDQDNNYLPAAAAKRIPYQKQLQSCRHKSRA
jgi:hypothetical protein